MRGREHILIFCSCVRAFFSFPGFECTCYQKAAKHTRGWVKLQEKLILGTHVCLREHGSQKQQVSPVVWQTHLGLPGLSNRSEQTDTLQGLCTWKQNQPRNFLILPDVPFCPKSRNCVNMVKKKITGPNWHRAGEGPVSTPRLDACFNSILKAPEMES